MEQNSFYKEGMVGVSLVGDIRMRSFITQGARRVGPTFHADKVHTARGRWEAPYSSRMEPLKTLTTTLFAHFVVAVFLFLYATHS